MNFSSSCRNPNPDWACFKNLSRGYLASFTPGQPTQKCSSSSTMPELHVLHELSSTGRQTYLPISICNRAVPPFRWASRDLCTFTLVFCIYPSVEHALLQNYYFQLVMVTMCLNVAWHYWNSLETSLKSVYFRVDIVQKQYCLLHNRSSILGEWLFFKLRRMTECIPILTRAGYEYNILSE